MKTKTIRQSVTFKTSPHVIYEMLMDSRKHAKFTGEKASISRKIGGKFTAYAGYIHGVNLNLVQQLFNPGVAATGQRDIFPR